MKYRAFGKKDFQVSEIGYGAWGIGGGWGELDDKAAIDSLRMAYDLGINFIDTAYAYGDGHSEELIGQAFFGSEREKVRIATKVPPETFQWPALDSDPVEENFSSRWITQCAERSLKKLNTDHLDVLQLHAWADAWLDKDEWKSTFERLKKEGKVLAVGVSANDWNPYNTERLARSGLVDSIQVIYNLFEQRPAEKLFPAALESKTAIIVRVPFEEGLLTGKFREGHQFEESDWRAKWMTPERLKEAEPRIQALENELGNEAGSLPELTLKFILSHPAVTTVIPGMRRREHVEANTAVSDAEPLSSDKAEQLKSHAWAHGWKYPWDKTA